MDNEEVEEKPDYYIDGLIDAWFNGPKTLEGRNTIHETLNEMRKKADIYARKKNFDDELMERGMERMLRDIWEEVYKFKTSRGN